MKQVCVIGLGQFGTHLARKLVHYGCEVLAVDQDDARIEPVRDDVHRAVIGDARSQAMLESVISDSLDEAFISMGDHIESSILCALNLRKLGVKRIVSTAVNDDHAAILTAVGANAVIFPERETAERAARRIANPGLRDMFSLEEDYRIMELTAPGRMHGRSLGDINLRASFDVLVLAVREPQSAHWKFLPSADSVIHPQELLMVLGRELDLVRFSQWR